MKQIQLYAAIAIVAIGVLFGLGGITKINPGEVGILIKQLGANRGMQEETLDVGVRWVNPIAYDTVTYNTKFRQYEIDQITAETKDGQPISLDISLEIGKVPSGVPNLHSSIGTNWYEEVVLPSARKTIREASSSQVSSKVYTSEGRIAIAKYIDDTLQPKLEKFGIIISTNVRNIKFLNAQFVDILEQKSIAAEREEIERRNALAAVQIAEKMKNIAEGEKQKRIKAAEARKEEQRLEGEGLRLLKEEKAKGILAVKQAEAEGQRLLVNAYGAMGAQAVVGIAWAENLGPNVKVYGVPTGAPGTTSIVDINSVLQGAFGAGK